MNEREKLIEILSIPLFPAEEAADFLLDNNVVPVVRCRDCESYDPEDVGSIPCKHADGMCNSHSDSYCSVGKRRQNNGHKM